ncbi:hypothetical protein [Rhizobium leguminosarum]|nr:hypothetical protein [Rhizobium leguminosarum]
MLQFKIWPLEVKAHGALAILAAVTIILMVLWRGVLPPLAI